jgi:hypothetical protein
MDISDMQKNRMKKTLKPQPDAENPEWTREDFARAISFKDLPDRFREAISGSRMATKEITPATHPSVSTRNRG